ncbi:MAG TPA: hypothetical protein VIO95_07130 [Mycobacterium sp.]
MTGPLTCGVCGIGFGGRADAMYCSSACRQKAHRARTARRIAEWAGQQRPRVRAARAIIKPDVANTIQRAQREQRRARELCRTAADTLRESVAAKRRLAAIQWSTERG